MKARRLDRFRVLSEYECGRAQIAIEWVARSQKPIVEVGGCPIEGCDFDSLASDLNRCIARSGENVKAFIVPDKMRGYCCYGFYRFPWAIRALLHVWGIERAANDKGRSLWEQGLVFGYSADAIQRLISSASFSRASSSRPRLCSHHDRRRRVEMYGIPESLVRRHSSRNGKSRKSRSSYQS